MQKSYSYYEYDFLIKQQFHDSMLFNQEQKKALDFIMSDEKQKRGSDICPICGSKNTNYFFSKWEIDYLMCRKCASIFVPVLKETLDRYLNQTDLKDIRLSNEYQEKMFEKRETMWNEFVNFLSYKAFRYLGINENLEILDIGNRYLEFTNLLRNSNICSKYELRNSMLSIKTDDIEKADILLYMNQLQNKLNPKAELETLKSYMKKNSILVLNTRVGSGIDILTLKGNLKSIYPYEHIVLPSIKGLSNILDETGYEILEISTPGTLDISNILEEKHKIEPDNFFIKSIFDVADNDILADLQLFIQKSCLSSFAQVICRVRNYEKN